jgi:hypothetical protein
MAPASLDARFLEAHQAPNPTSALHALALALKAEGMTQVDMYRLFSEHQQKTDAGDPRYDAIVDNMDRIWGGGWAKRHALFEHQLTDAEIADPPPEEQDPGVA